MTTYITSEAQKIIDWQTIIEQMYSGNKEKKKKEWHKNRITKPWGNYIMKQSKMYTELIGQKIIK